MSCLLELNDDCSEKVYYDFTEYPIYIRDALLSAYPNYSASSHWHDDIEFIVILSGSMNYNVNGQVIHLKEEEGIFINARQLHFGFSERIECEFLCIRLHPLLLCTSPAMEQDFITPLIQNQEMTFLKLSQENDLHRKLLVCLKQINLAKGSPAAPLKVQAAFSSIWAALYENMPKATENNGRAIANLTAVKAMVGFIQQHYREKISLGEIAKAGAVGKSKCCKLFRTYLNQTPNEYLIGYRLNKSGKLLCNTDMTVSEIALETGFCGASYYAETFRKWFGQSPTEYRLKNAHQ